MEKVNRREFAWKAIGGGGALAFMGALIAPKAASAFTGPEIVIPTHKLLNRPDLADALKSLHMTYDSIKPYPHKFNETTSKHRLRAIEFFVKQGKHKEYAEHYVATLKPVLLKIKETVEKENNQEKALTALFDDNPEAFQLFERINAKPGERTFPCPYKGKISDCRYWLGTFTAIEWKDVCDKWCMPTWNGIAETIGIKIKITPSDQCSVKLV
jgi:hypothetical protein